MRIGTSAIPPILCFVSLVSFAAITVMMVLPIILSIIWTIFIFDILWAITLRYKFKKRVLWTLCLIYSSYYFILTFFPMFDIYDEIGNQIIKVILIVITSLFQIIIFKFLVTDIIGFIKKRMPYTSINN